MMTRWTLGTAAVVAMLVTGCERQADQSGATQPAPTRTTGAQEVVVYTAVDQVFSEPILNDFEARTGIRVRAVYDAESTKTIGLVNRLRAEKSRPRCDVFWNNEIVNTVRLNEEGLFQAYRSPAAAGYPERFRDPQDAWCGLATRARVLIVNTNLVKPEELPTTVRDLADPRWKGRIGIAKPLFGTNASHVALLFAKLGAADAKSLLAAIKANGVQVLGGNKIVAEAVGAGRLAIGLTDTDDAVAETDAGHPVKIVYPDGAPDGMGTVLLPNTVSLMKDCPHPETGKRLIDYLLSPEVEARLAEGPSAQIPLNLATTARSRVGELKDIRPMDVDLAKGAAEFDAAMKYLEQEFLAP